ncbi:MAG: RNA polymerase sigma factor [Dongiaceae bacterium]
MRRYALALLGDRAQADDLVQDCLERAWSRLHLWRRGNLRGWLFTIMHNLNANDRRRRRRAPWTTPLDEAGAAAATRATQEDGLAVEALTSALAALPEDQRAVVLLVGLEEFSYADAAGVLGVPVGTVMSRLHRGREQLRRRLAGGAEPGLRRVK